MAAISHTSDNWIVTEQNLISAYVSQPPDANKNVAQSADYERKQKQSGFERNAKTILGFERFLSKIGDNEKNCQLMIY